MFFFDKPLSNWTSNEWAKYNATWTQEEWARWNDCNNHNKWWESWEYSSHHGCWIKAGSVVTSWKSLEVEEKFGNRRGCGNDWSIPRDRVALEGCLETILQEDPRNWLGQLRDYGLWNVILDYAEPPMHWFSVYSDSSSPASMQTSGRFSSDDEILSREGDAEQLL